MLLIFAVLLLVLSGSAVIASQPYVPSPLVKGAWYAGWHAANGFPLSSIPWKKYNTMYYSFAIPTADIGLTLDGSDGELLPQFVSMAQDNGVQAHVAIGGWDGSEHFSSSIATPENRTAFVKAIGDFVAKYQLQGIQIDWEYPSVQGIGCNTISKDDTANLLAFLQDLRQNTATQDKIISAAVTLTPFADGNGNPLRDVTAFADILDYIAVMNYDVWGSWSPGVGPNAPLNDTCAVPADRMGSAVSAVKAWTDAGMQAYQIVLGVAGYGHAFSVTPGDAYLSGTHTLGPYPKFNASNQPLGDPWDNTGGTDGCGVYQGSGGTWNLWGLVDGGFLTKKIQPADGIEYRYDDCSQTMFLYNATSQVMISFDDVQAFAAKGRYIIDAGLLGFSMWEAGSDYEDALLDAIVHAMEA